MKSNPKKLMLRKETMKSLTVDQLGEIAGGIGGSFTSPNDGMRAFGGGDSLKQLGGI